MNGQCTACEVLMINGVRCHEIGCTEAWKEQTRQCRLCGDSFKPDHRYQNTCTDCLNEENCAEVEYEN